MDFDKRMGRDLKVLRRLWRISQTEMAELLGIHQTAVCRVEDGTQKLTTEQFLKLRAWIKEQPNMFLDREI